MTEIEHASEELLRIHFVIRPGTAEDIGAMALVLERANAERDGLLPPLEVTDLERASEVKERAAKPSAWIYVADGPDGVAAFVLGHASSEEETLVSDDNVEYLSLLMTDPTHWGRGLGRSLLFEAEANIRAAGKKQVVLWTQLGNGRARRLYERSGYRLTDQTRVSVHQGQLVQYQLDL